jgi:hypothetical protein
VNKSANVVKGFGEKEEIGARTQQAQAVRQGDPEKEAEGGSIAGDRVIYTEEKK